MELKPALFMQDSNFEFACVLCRSVSRIRSSRVALTRSTCDRSKPNRAVHMKASLTSSKFEESVNDGLHVGFGFCIGIGGRGVETELTTHYHVGFGVFRFRSRCIYT